MVKVSPAKSQGYGQDKINIMVKVSPTKSQGYGQDTINIMVKIRSRLWSRLVPQKIMKL